MLFDIISDTVNDAARLLPFLFLTYLLMEFLEHRTGTAAVGRIRRAGRFGPVWGALLGAVPQCGFSAAAASLYAGRVITVGTLLAVYLSTSDEMLPILLAGGISPARVGKILAVKAAAAMLSGLMVEFVRRRLMRCEPEDIDIHTVCEEQHCSCEDGLFISALRHTVQIFFYLLLVEFILNGLLARAGGEGLASLFSGAPVLGGFMAALIGLIPNCASSVAVTQLYLRGVIGAGAMMAGLFTNAGVGILVLLRLNRHGRQNAGIIALLFGFGLFWGGLIRLAGISF